MTIYDLDEKTLYWLVGLLEGEACFLKPSPSTPNSPRVSLHMTDRDIVERVAQLFQRKVTFVRRQKIHHKDSYRVYLQGQKAVDLMKRIQPLMGIRRQKQIQRAIDCYSSENNQRWIVLQKLSDKNISWAKENAHLSLRKRAKILGVNHETLRQRLLIGYKVLKTPVC